MLGALVPFNGSRGPDYGVSNALMQRFQRTVSCGW
jgi:hypothetical protein